MVPSNTHRKEQCSEMSILASQSCVHCVRNMVDNADIDDDSVAADGFVTTQSPRYLFFSILLYQQFCNGSFQRTSSPTHLAQSRE